MNELISMIREFGFPIFVCLWFMFRTEKIIKENTKVLNDLSHLISKLVERLGD